MASPTALADHPPGSMEDYTLHQTLGKGHFATVKLAERVDSGELVALKIIEVSEQSSSRQDELFQREIQAMRTVQHPNVLSLRNISPNVQWPRDNGESRTVTLFELELAPGGELFDYLLVGGAFPEPVARAYFQQILLGLQACHSEGVFHRDLKPENILMSQSYELKLADFGLAAINPYRDLLHTPCGTASYQAPEVLRRQPYDGEKADVWSAGVVLFIMLAGNPPFRKAARGDWWFNAISLNAYDSFWMAHQRPPIPTIHREAQELINSIFVIDKSRRASVEELLASDWLQHGSAEATAPLPDSYFLNAFMAERRAVIDEQNEHKKANAKALRAQRRASGGGGGGGAGAAVFDKDVHRSVGGDPDAAAAAQAPAGAGPEGEIAGPPVLTHDQEAGSTALYRMYATDPPAHLLGWLATAARRALAKGGEDGHIQVEVDPVAFTVSASGNPNSDDGVSLHLELRAMPADQTQGGEVAEDGQDGGVLCVHATRAEGNPWEFGQAWKDLLGQLAALGCLGASDALASGAAPMLGMLAEPSVALPGTLPEEEPDLPPPAPEAPTVPTEEKISELFDAQLVL